MAAPIAVVAEDASMAPEVQRRVSVVVLASRIRGYAAMVKASSDSQVEKVRLPRRQARQALAISGHQPARAGESPGGCCQPAAAAPAG